MGQSLVKNYIHIVFSTKHRKELIYPPFENELYAYIGGVCNELECPVIKVGGHKDHIHILCMLSKKTALMNLVQKIKSNSSKWYKSKDDDLRNFSWQNGYGSFSVSPTHINIVKAYIENQHQHHKTKTFKDEYRGFLRKYGIEYDEKYVWD